MIRSFSDKTTEALFNGNAPKGIAMDIATRAHRLLKRVHAAREIGDLRTPPSNRLHKLQGDKKDRWSVSVNMQYRVTFRFEDGHAEDVKFEDYH